MENKTDGSSTAADPCVGRFPKGNTLGLNRGEKSEISNLQSTLGIEKKVECFSVYLTKDITVIPS